MSVLRRIGSGAWVAVMIGLMAACSSGPKASTTPPKEPEITFHEPTPDVDEELVGEPRVEPIVSEEVQEELPQDIQELNRRGYLQDIFFDTDRYDLKPEAREILARNSSWLQQFQSVRILVEGHCDERNTREYNLALGERRANAVRDYLVFLGIAPNRVRTISYGEERPFALGHDESAWRLNRRSHFVITAR